MLQSQQTTPGVSGLEARAAWLARLISLGSMRLEASGGWRVVTFPGTKSIEYNAMLLSVYTRTLASPAAPEVGQTQCGPSGLFQQRCPQIRI